MHPEGSRRDVAAAPEVVEDLLEPVIGAGERVLAGYNPSDLGREQLTQRATVPAGVKLVLRSVKLVEEGCRRGPVQRCG